MDYTGLIFRLYLHVFGSDNKCPLCCGKVVEPVCELQEDLKISSHTCRVENGSLKWKNPSVCGAKKPEILV